jgi:hypothetical protein
LEIEEYLQRIPQSGDVRRRKGGKWVYKNPTGETSCFETKKKALESRQKWMPWQSQFVTLGILSHGDTLTYQSYRSNTREIVTVMGTQSKKLLVRHNGKEKTLEQVQVDLNGPRGGLSFNSFKIDKLGGKSLQQVKKEIQRHCRKEKVSPEETQMSLELPVTTATESATQEQLTVSVTNLVSSETSFTSQIVNFTETAISLMPGNVSIEDRVGRIGRALVAISSTKVVDN